ncbi:MAG TPA: phosphotransferase [Burkholderiaceae bacterium]|nr:phosphotransferase [Burkholderiaceae bacterium]
MKTSAALAGIADDPRVRALRLWLEDAPRGLGAQPDTLRAASADASFRRYFRLDANGTAGRSLIAMDAPPEREDSRPYIVVARLLAEAGLHAPKVLIYDLAQGFLLLTDLGATTYLNEMNGGTGTVPGEGRINELFSDAIDALVKWQLASDPNALPPYDEALLRRELDLFPDWYLDRHLCCTMTPQQRATLAQQYRLILDACLAQPRVYVHRDYMPRNLMVSTPNPGVLDFQDAVYGPITYDVVSLFRDAFISWDEERVLDWTIRYWERARRAGLPVREDFGEFYRDFEWMGLQRHLKVLGIFARINYRDGKSHYLTDTPRFVRYVRAVTQRYNDLAPLARLFDDFEGIARQIGYTF